MISTYASQQPAFRGGGAPVYDADASALFSRMTVQPNDQRKTLINSLIVGLKDGGLWSKLDLLYLMAAHDAQAGRLNWKSADFTLQTVNAPAFTVDRGFTGDGSSAYLNTEWAPINGTQFQQDSASIGVWVNETGPVTQGDDGRLAAGNGNTFILTRSTSNQLRGRANQPGTNNVSGSVENRRGFSVLTRRNSGGIAGYRDGTLLGTAPVASVSPDMYSIMLCLGRNVGISSGLISPANFTSEREAVLAIGGGLTDAQVATLHNQINTYLTAIGGN